MMTIDKFNFAGKKAIVRVDFNVPLDENGKITDDTRIRGALPTLKKILADGGALIIMSHMGKPKGKVNAKYSLSQIVDAVSAALGTPVGTRRCRCLETGRSTVAGKPPFLSGRRRQTRRHRKRRPRLRSCQERNEGSPERFRQNIGFIR